MATEHSDLLEAGARLEAAVTAGQYEAAQKHLAEYVKLVAAARQGPALREALQLIDSARRAVLAGRAHLAAKYASLPRASCGYAPPKRPPSHSLDFKG